MTILRKLILIGALLAAAPPSIAQDAHHPDTAAEPAPPVALPTPGGQTGMGGAGMMSEMMSGMMGPGMMSMMSMMASMGQMMAPEHIEGRLAFLRTELGITEAQQPLWLAFADALRANAHSMAGAMAGMQDMPQPPGQAALPQRVELQERMLAARLDGLRQISAALQPLYAALDDAQKQIADALIVVGPMGLM